MAEEAVAAAGAVGVAAEEVARREAEVAAAPPAEVVAEAVAWRPASEPSC